MKRLGILALSVLFCLGAVGPAFAGATKDEAKAMVDKAAAYYQANGKEKALKEFNNAKGEFVRGKLYIFAYDKDFTVIAHPTNQKSVGGNTPDMPDVDGKYFRK